MRTFGIDVSHWEGHINWQLAAASINFAYFKCTDGTRFVDTCFHQNQQGCLEAGLPHAPYHYFQPTIDPVAQAEHFITTAGRDYRRYIVDVEAPERISDFSRRLLRMLEHIEELTGKKPAIYTSAGYWNDFIRPRPAWADEYDLIVAHYTAQHSPLLPAGWNKFIIWQFTDHWYTPGCDEVADGNWFNGSLEQCREWFGNYRAVNPASTPATRMRSLFDNLHIRQSPSLNARITGGLEKEEVVEVEQLGGNDIWIRHKRGWTVVERGGYRYMEVIK